MKKLQWTLILAGILLTSGVQARDLWAFLSYSSFNSPEGPYLETYLSVAANSVQFVKQENGQFKATVNILMTFKQGNEIKAFRKYELNSSEVADTANRNFYFVDQQRFSLPNGTYEFEIQMADKFKETAPTPSTRTIAIDYPEGKAAFSDVEFIKSYTRAVTPTALSKSGFDLVPYTYTFFPENETKMTFYSELYNMDRVTGADKKFLLSYYIESFEHNVMLSSYIRPKKETARNVNVLLTEVDISNLPTGNYNLVLEARGTQNEVIATKKMFFQRMNPAAQVSMADLGAAEIANTFAEKITNIDSLREYISCTYPIATGLEKAFSRVSMKKSDLHTLQQFFFTFWQARDHANPEKAWLAYKEQVEKVQFNFGTPVKKGYQTDRGRVYLEYGPPNTRSQQNMEPSNYPYEIWQYYTLNNNQRNRKFVFYSPDRVTSDFILLHSDATGEVNNPRWKIDLRNRIYGTRDLQDTQVISSWGDMQSDYWELPN
ncbi:MAG TPA: GWxTD domain-containing protein [Bacteroidales bacterium]|nr:GWxTD domain-containing protein [Bacteroidales bacterium]